jgi:hypothetical protein
VDSHRTCYAGLLSRTCCHTWNLKNPNNNNKGQVIFSYFSYNFKRNYPHLMNKMTNYSNKYLALTVTCRYYISDQITSCPRSRGSWQCSRSRILSHFRPLHTSTN